MNWNDKKVLVTGSGGFIGSHLTETLVELGAEVTGLVRYNSRGALGWLDELYREHKNNFKIEFGDLRDAETMKRIIKGKSHVFHLGAMISIPYSYVNPAEASAVNVEGSMNVFNACREYDVERVVTTSTSEVYGTAQYVPIDEKHPLQGQSPYSASKIGADKLAESYYDSFNLPVVTIRPFNTFGPRQSIRSIIPTVAVQCIKGNEVRVGNLSPTRDFTYVSDTVAGMLAAGSTAGIEGMTLNLGTGVEIKISDLITLIARLSENNVKVVTEEKRIRPEKSEVMRLCADNTLAREKMGWQPEVSLEDGLKATLGWLRENMSWYEDTVKGYLIY